MGDLIKCPACCDKYFISKAELIEHLAPFLGEIECPVCKDKWSSMGHLLDHLSLDECTPNGTFKIEQYNLEETQPDESQSGELHEPKLGLQNDGFTTQSNITDFISNTKEIEPPVDLEDSKMYVEFLNKQLLQTQEVKLVKDNGISRYIFVTDEGPAVDSDSTIVTKQNHDGTISLTTVKEVPVETDTLITPDTEIEINEQEIYSCPTCGVSFTSVADHIQNYHNDQDVVVEDPVDGCDSDVSAMNSIAPDNPVDNDDVSNDHGLRCRITDSPDASDEVSNDHGSRRMITDTGDIVETHAIYNCKTKSITLDTLQVPVETDTLITPDTEIEINEQEIYSCPTCGVSFTSVADHIQNYHNDQDVVVEDPVDGCDSDVSAMNSIAPDNPVDNDDVSNDHGSRCRITDSPVASDEVSNDHGSRRMITDTGDIVETHAIYNSKTKSINLDTLHSSQDSMLYTLQEIKEEGKPESKGKAADQTILNKKIDSNDNAVVKNIKEPDDLKGGKYHKVILKEVTNGSTNEKIRLFQCISCHVHVSNLDDFKNKACKVDSSQDSMLYTLQEIKEEGKPESKGKAADQTILNKKIDSNDYAVIKNIKEPDDLKGGKYHKVILKEVTNGSTNEKIRLFQCISCHVHVSNLDDFKNKPCKVLKYQCVHCPVAYESAKSLCAHMKIHKKGASQGTNGLTTYGCEICKTVFTNNKSLKLHKRMHDPIKGRPIEPPVETAGGGIVSTDKFLCVVCLKLIPMDYKVIHQNSHIDVEKFNCDICNKKFTSKEYLDMHLNVHNVDKVSVARQDEDLPYKCIYCERRFNRPHEKVKHERIHTGEKPHSCEICGKSFRVSYCLTLHMRTHTGARPYACPHCGKRFKAHSVYNHHVLTHSDERNYKCPYCPKAFKTSVQLAGHKNSHTKPFACQYCNRPFASLYAVRVHTETHSRQNNLKFSCTICGASYARAFALNDHVKQAHEDDGQDNVAFTKIPTNPHEHGLKGGDDDAKDSQNNSEDDENIMMEIINTNDLVVP